MYTDTFSNEPSRRARCLLFVRRKLRNKRKYFHERLCIIVFFVEFSVDREYLYVIDVSILSFTENLI